jgi:DNA-binding FrmR family transcriptional regulator
MLPKDLTADIKNRLKSIKGQVEGIIKMLDEGREPEQIIFQFKAVDKGLQKAHHLLLDDVYRKVLAIKIVNATNECPGNCGNEEKIEFLRKKFPNFKSDELTQMLREIHEIEERLARYNGKLKNS